MSKSNCCIPQFICGVQGIKTNCQGFVPTDTPRVTCKHLNSSGMCTCALMINEKIDLLYNVIHTKGL